VVGFRLLALSRRTGELPERLLGLGLLSMAVIGGPVAGTGRAPGIVATPIGNALFAVGIAFVQIGMACFLAFTWRVFRAGSTWAMGFVMLGCGALGVEWQGLVSASVGADMEEIFQHTRGWAIAVVATLATVSIWACLEAWSYHRKLVRRLALGMADPAIANRIWLWAVAGGGVAAISLAMIPSMVAGVPPLHHPAALALIATAAFVASGCWWLAFFPPARYLARVRARAAHA